MTLNFSLRSARAGIHMRAFRTPKYSLNQAYTRGRLRKTVSWWNHDHREVCDNGSVRDRPSWVAAFGSGDPVTHDQAREWRVPILRSMIDRANSAADWQAATDVHEYRVAPATRAYEAQLLARMAAERASKAPTPQVRSDRDIMLERVTTTGASGLGKARRKVAA